MIGLIVGTGLLAADLQSMALAESIIIIERDAEEIQVETILLAYDTELLALEMQKLVEVAIDAKDDIQGFSLKNTVPPSRDKHTLITTRCRGDP